MAKTVYAGKMKILNAWLNKVFNHRHDGLDQDGSSSIDYAADTGAADAYVVALAPALTAYIVGLPMWFKAANANTAGSTGNVNGLGAKTIKKGGNALITGDILANQIYCIIYDGTDLQLHGTYNAIKLLGYTASPTPGASVIPVGDAGGRIAWGAKPAFRGAFCYLDANQAILNATETSIAFPTAGVVYNTDSIWNSANPSRFTVPTGITKVKMNVGTNWEADNTGNRLAYLFKNGAYVAPNVVDRRLAVSESEAVVSSPVLPCVGGDYFQWMVLQNSGGTLNLLPSAWAAMEVVE